MKIQEMLAKGRLKPICKSKIPQNILKEMAKEDKGRSRTCEDMHTNSELDDELLHIGKSRIISKEALNDKTAMVHGINPSSKCGSPSFEQSSKNKFLDKNSSNDGCSGDLIEQELEEIFGDNEVTEILQHAPPSKIESTILKDRSTKAVVTDGETSMLSPDQTKDKKEGDPIPKRKILPNQILMPSISNRLSMQYGVECTVAISLPVEGGTDVGVGVRGEVPPIKSNDTEGQDTTEVAPEGINMPNFSSKEIVDTLSPTNSVDDQFPVYKWGA